MSWHRGLASIIEFSLMVCSSSSWDGLNQICDEHNFVTISFSSQSQIPQNRGTIRRGVISIGIVCATCVHYYSEIMLLRLYGYIFCHCHPSCVSASLITDRRWYTTLEMTYGSRMRLNRYYCSVTTTSWDHCCVGSMSLLEPCWNSSSEATSQRWLRDEKRKPAKITREKAPKDIHVGLVTLCNVKSAYTSQDSMISRDALKVSMKKKRRGFGKWEGLV